MTKETEIKKAIKQYFNVLHIFWFYNLQGLGAYPGIPDLCFISPKKNKFVFLEVKAPKGKLWLTARDVDDVINYCKNN